jgi:sugar (pentulose or hexulose) kinase
LTLETSRADILKGIMEGAVFYHRALVDALTGTGIRMRELRVVGGGSRSEAWPRIAADILGLPLVATAVSEAGTLGAAIIAAAGAGEFSSIAEGAAAMVSTGRRFVPDPARVRAYGERYERYRALWPAMRGLLATS